MTEKFVELNPTRLSESAQILSDKLHSRVIGQAQAIEEVVKVFQKVQLGLVLRNRPLSVLLFLGPTGSGKTHIVEIAAEILFGDCRAMIKVDCAEFQHSHEIAKLIGSPPGYLGHRETHPLITEESLKLYYTDTLKFSFLLFDEIEKASDSLWKLLLGILDKATLTLGDNRRIDLSNTMIFMTSNLGGSQITELMTGGLGFIQSEDSGLEDKIERTATQAAKSKFMPEFINRIDKIVVFHPLQAAQLEQILNIELNLLQERMIQTDLRPILSFTARSKSYLLAEGTSKIYGARELKRTVEKYIVNPLSNILSSGQLKVGERVIIDCPLNELRFLKAKSA